MEAGPATARPSKYSADRVPEPPLAGKERRMEVDCGQFSGFSRRGRPYAPFDAEMRGREGPRPSSG